MADHETLALFENAGAGAATTFGPRYTEARQSFLTGLLATWAAGDREPGAKPTKDELRQAAEGAKAALGEIS